MEIIVMIYKNQIWKVWQKIKMWFKILRKNWYNKQNNKWKWDVYRKKQTMKLYAEFVGVKMNKSWYRHVNVKGVLGTHINSALLNGWQPITIEWLEIKLVWIKE